LLGKSLCYDTFSATVLIPKPRQMHEDTLQIQLLSLYDVFFHNHTPPAFLQQQLT